MLVPEMEREADLTEMDSSKRLMLLMTRHQRRISSYIYTLVPDRHAVDDLMQETSLVIVEKFHEFEPGTDFVAWACQIAYWRIRAARQKFARAKVVFDQDVVDAIAQTAATLSEELDERHEALERCLQKLHGWNPNPALGALGALRAEIGRNFIVGTTPLRDGRWHHIAVVFVPGEPAERLVQVKQYVDGKLEGITAKQLKEHHLFVAQTDRNDDAADEFLWIGHPAPRARQSRELFIGALDELLIADRALTPREIVQLMKNNLLPQPEALSKN